MIEITADLWRVPNVDARVITTNGYVRSDGQCVMGRGCARQARDMFPGIAAHLGQLIRSKGNHTFDLGVWETEPNHRGAGREHRIISLPVKHDWAGQADIELIKRSIAELAQLVTVSQYYRVVMPRPGCGNGRLNWETTVRPILRDIGLDDRFIVVNL